MDMAARKTPEIAVIGAESSAAAAALADRLSPGRPAPPMSFEAFACAYAADRGRFGVVFVVTDEAGLLERLLAAVQEGDYLRRLRVVACSRDPGVAALVAGERYDVHAHIAPDAPTGELRELAAHAAAAFEALQTTHPVREFYLDNTFHEVIEWFEKTRWAWNELPDLRDIDRDRVTEADVATLREGAFLEFGTLPGADNFLREWHDDFGFVTWALQWGGEEARHSLVQARYLKALGHNVRSNQALFKRKPYPMGHNRAATLMMNIISEYRAAHYYARHAARSEEPVLRRIWRLLSKDEARHANAFYIFCRELCELDGANTLEALKMAYVWLADRAQGVKHPAGFFFQHSTSTQGARLIEAGVEGATTQADDNVYRVIQRLTGNADIKDSRSLKDEIRRRL